jgi:hypothetical protein
MKINVSNKLIILLVILGVLAAYAYFSYCAAKKICPVTSPVINPGIEMIDAKMAIGLDDQLMPVQVTDVFPRDTRRVFCWFSWDNATPKMEMKAEWNYVVDDVHILTYDFRIPRKKGSGGISLIMPTGKVFPVGSYRIDLVSNKIVVKSLTFKVK